MSTEGLQFSVESVGTRRDQRLSIERLIIAGWTGSDVVAMEAHIVELEKLGVARPLRTPMFYRAASALLTQSSVIEVVGGASSGEVEPVIFNTPEGLYLGLGSDHTDRKVETIGVTISKQMCAKPVAPRLWRFDDVADHWDSLIIRSWATCDGRQRLYQEGSLGKMRHPRDLIGLYEQQHESFRTATAMFCGTLAVHGEITPSASFQIELEDPVLHRKITHGYRIQQLPIEG